MTKEELEKATEQELIEQRDYCGVDGYYGNYLEDVNAEMLKRFNRLEELEKENAELKEQNIKDCENFNKTMSETKERWNKEHYQLAKAKSIIQSFVWWHTGEDRGSINSNDLVERAKQFLSEAEK